MTTLRKAADTPYSYTLTVRDAAGNLVTPTAAPTAFAFTNADRTLGSVTLAVAPIAGQPARFTVTGPATAAGQRYLLHLIPTALGTREDRDDDITFEVVSGSVSPSIIPLEEFKAHVGDPVGSDAELARFLDAAEAMIVERCGPLTPVEVVEDHRAPGGVIVLREWPVISVSAVTRYPGATAVLVEDFSTSRAGYTLDRDAGLLRYPFGHGNARVVYQAGRAVLGEHLRNAIKDLGQHLWNASQNRVGVGGRTVYGGRDPEETRPYPAGFAMPRAVAEAIQYELRPFVGIA